MNGECNSWCSCEFTNVTADPDDLCEVYSIDDWPEELVNEESKVNKDWSDTKWGQLDDEAKIFHKSQG